nr:immunoglobulin heavy chain junction region [Mus musculus]
CAIRRIWSDWYFDVW